MQQDDPVGHGVDGDRFDSVLTRLTVARKCLQAFPANNPSVIEALEKLEAATDQFFADGQDDALVFTFLLEGMLANGDPIAAKRDVVRRLAKDMYRAGVQTVTITRGVTAGEWERFLTAMTGPTRSAGGRGHVPTPLREVDLDHIRIEGPATLELVEAPEPDGGLDLVAYLKMKIASGRRAREAIDVSQAAVELLAELSTFFLDVAEGSQEKRQYLFNTLAEPEKLTAAFAFLAAGAGVPGGDTQGMRALHRAFEHIAEIIRALPPDSRGAYIANIARAMMTAGPGARHYLVNEFLLPNASASDFEGAVLATLSDADFADVLNEHVKIHKGTAGALRTAFQGLAADDYHRNTLGRLLEKNLLSFDEEQLREVKSLLESSDEPSKTPPPPPSAKDNAVFSRLLAGRDALMRELIISPEEMSALGRTVAEACEDAIHEHAARALLGVYLQNGSVQLPEKLLELFESDLLGILAQGHYRALARLLDLIENAMSGEARAAVHASLGAVFEEIASPKHVDTILGMLRTLEKDSPEYMQMTGLLRTLGDPAANALFARLIEEKNRSTRLLILGVFAQLGESNIEFLAGKANHPEWFVVRNVVYLLGKIGTEAVFPVLANVLAHHDARVRKEVLNALAGIGGPRAEELLIACLGDRDEDVVRHAAAWLGHMGAERARPALAKTLTARAKVLHKHPELAMAIVNALAKVGGPEEAALLKRFAPGKLRFWRHKRSELAEACSKAVAAIRERT